MSCDGRAIAIDTSLVCGGHGLWSAVGWLLRTGNCRASPELIWVTSDLGQPPILKAFALSHYAVVKSNI
jgi:hypothetical protein